MFFFVDWYGLLKGFLRRKSIYLKMKPAEWIVLKSLLGRFVSKLHSLAADYMNSSRNLKPWSQRPNSVKRPRFTVLKISEWRLPFRTINQSCRSSKKDRRGAYMRICKNPNSGWSTLSCNNNGVYISRRYWSAYRDWDSGDFFPWI